MTKKLTITKTKTGLTIDSDGFSPNGALKVLDRAIKAIKKSQEKHNFGFEETEEEIKKQFRKDNEDVFSNAEFDFIEKTIEALGPEDIEGFAKAVAKYVDTKRKGK